MKRKIKYKDIPYSFIPDNWDKAVNFCDSQTPLVCYCGRIATGFHTNSCQKFISHVHRFLENMYNNQTTGVKQDEQEKASNA